MEAGEVWISEDEEHGDSPDEQVVHWSGFFSASYLFTDGDSTLTRLEEGPTHVPVHEAIAWARERSHEVYVQVGDVLYTAGETKAPELPQWQEQTSIRARTEVIARDPWLDRTELDDPIDWDVVIAPSASPMTDDPRFEDAFARLLTDAGISLVENRGTSGFASRIAIRVSARTQANACEAATKAVVPIFGSALREFAMGPTGWTIGVDARPSGEDGSPSS